jgi:predicted nuclease with TOPRIM domain
MGWASYLEDIIERLSSDLDEIRNASTPDIERPAKLRALIRVCERFIADINEHLEVATDPQLDLANELIKLKEANRRLGLKANLLEENQQRLKELETKYSNLEKRFNEVNGKSAKRYAEMKELEKKYEKLEKEHSRMGRNKRR